MRGEAGAAVHLASASGGLQKLLSEIPFSATHPAFLRPQRLASVGGGPPLRVDADSAPQGPPRSLPGVGHSFSIGSDSGKWEFRGASQRLLNSRHSCLPPSGSRLVPKGVGRSDASCQSQPALPFGSLA